MRDLERRLERLEDIVGAADCTCAGPGLVVVKGNDPDPPPLPDCPHHGAHPQLVVRIRSHSAAPPIDLASEPFARRLPGGYVEALLPGPE